MEWRGWRRPGPSQDLLVDGLVGVRYTGPTRAVMVGPEVRATAAFGRWLAGLVARYDSAVRVMQPVPDQFSMSSMTVGLTAGYRLLSRPVELSLAVEPTLAVAMMGAQRPGMDEPDVDTLVDMRLGTRLAAAIPLGERLRAACGIEAEGAPAALAGDRHSRHHALPGPPAYMVGFSAGLELLAIR